MNINMNRVYLYKYERFFPENWQFNHRFGLPLSTTNLLYLKDCPYHLTKCEIKSASKILIFLIFHKLGKIWKYNLSLHSKKQVFIFFMNREILTSPDRATFKNPKIS